MTTDNFGVSTRCMTVGGSDSGMHLRQRDGLGESDVGRSCARISWLGVRSLELASVVRNGQTKSGIRGHVDFTPEQRAIVSGELLSLCVVMDSLHRYFPLSAHWTFFKTMDLFEVFRLLSSSSTRRSYSGDGNNLTLSVLFCVKVQ
ncbi:hypothetical protein EYF80_022068 [Liparis tanakae]|uniref:Uncharacterized protein n=1 Tax=Liparis tanakae TaxID=230148 RepID=A0A4Z2HSF3_9TELE|nr:hypothetical protein EYF80_022068 [Liparis tanakae]